MEPWMIVLLVLVVVVALWRVKRTWSNARSDNEEQIRKKLEELKKKRDE